MKTLKNFVLLLLLSMSGICQAQNTKAAKYNNKIIKEQHEITPMIVAFLHMQTKHYVKKEHEWSEQERINIEKKLSKAIAHVMNLRPFEGDTELKEAALAWFELYRRSFDVEYEEIVAILGKKEKTEADIARVEEIKSKLIQEEESIDQRFAKAQENFAAKYQLSLREETFEACEVTH